MSSGSITRTLVLRSVRANVLRLLLTTFAVFVGVAFVSTAFGLADQLRGVIDTEDVVDLSGLSGNGLQIAAEGSGFSPPVQIDATLAEKVEALPGVASATPSYQQFIQFATDAPTQPGFGAIQSVALIDPFYAKDWRIVDGRAPTGPDEIALNQEGFTAALTGVGGTAEVLFPTGKRAVQVVARVERVDEPENRGGSAMEFVSAVAVADPDSVGEMLHSEGKAELINVELDPGADVNEVRTAIQEVLPDSLKVSTSAEVAQSVADQLETIATWIERVMLIFAGVIVFVGSFLVVNTFNMVVGQRMRELGLLRSVGADRSQVFRLVSGEAFFVGVVASILGLVFGVGASTLLGGLITGEGYEPVLTLRTIGMGLLIGIGVTMVASLTPALRAARISPLAAIDGTSHAASKSNRISTVIAVVLIAASAAALGAGLNGDLDFSKRIFFLIPGAIGLFVGTAALARFIARPIMLLFGKPVAWRQTAQLGAANAARNPRRTSSTAAALMIGLALTICVVTVGTSVRNALLDQFDTSTKGQLMVMSQGFVNIDGPTFAAALSDVDGVDTVVDYAMFRGDLTGDTNYHITQMTGAPLSSMPEAFDIGIVDGPSSGWGADDVILAEESARDVGVRVGDTVTLKDSSGTTRELKVAALHSRTALFGQAIVDSSLADSMSLSPFFQGTAVVTTPGASVPTVRAAVEDAAKNFPSTEVLTAQEAIDRAGSQINILLSIISALLFASVLLAGLGVTNTLVLSVVERQREIGLMRAIGATRRQMRSIVRWEALMTSFFGALLGTAIGTGLGIGIVSALPDSFVGVVSFPTGWIIACFVLSIVLALLASIWPAYRASRLDILDAIADH